MLWLTFVYQNKVLIEMTKEGGLVLDVVVEVFIDPRAGFAVDDFDGKFVDAVVGGNTNV